MATTQQSPRSDSRRGRFYPRRRERCQRRRRLGGGTACGSGGAWPPSPASPAVQSVRNCSSSLWWRAVWPLLRASSSRMVEGTSSQWKAPRPYWSIRSRTMTRRPSIHHPWGARKGRSTARHAPSAAVGRRHGTHPQRRSVDDTAAVGGGRDGRRHGRHPQRRRGWLTVRRVPVVPVRRPGTPRSLLRALPLRDPGGGRLDGGSSWRWPSGPRVSWAPSSWTCL